MVFCRNSAAGRGDKTELFVGGTGIRAFDCGAYGVTDTGYRRKYLETGLRSLFSGSSAQTIQAADLPEQRTEAVKEEVKPERKPFPIRASAEKKETGKIYGDESPEGQA